MLDGRGDDMWLLAPVSVREARSPGDTTQRKVVTLGGPTGEDDLPRITPKDASAGASGLIQCGTGFLAEAIDARWVPVSIGEVREHPGQDFRVEWGGSGV